MSAGALLSTTCNLYIMHCSSTVYATIHLARELKQLLANCCFAPTAFFQASGKHCCCAVLVVELGHCLTPPAFAESYTECNNCKKTIVSTIQCFCDVDLCVLPSQSKVASVAGVSPTEGAKNASSRFVTNKLANSLCELACTQ
jgi:hypothetical protein